MGKHKNPLPYPGCKFPLGSSYLLPSRSGGDNCIGSIGSHTFRTVHNNKTCTLCNQLVCPPSLVLSEFERDHCRVISFEDLIDEFWERVEGNGKNLPAPDLPLIIVRGIIRDCCGTEVDVGNPISTYPVYSIVHFATHAVASDGQPFYSTMILAPDSAPGHDGFLQAFEVLRTPLQAGLVVLSGCETAMGAEDLGQGLVGLVAAFQQAGARSVLATLWSIDEATAEVMAGFYDALAKGAATPAALRQAKLQMLKQRLRMGNVELSLAHPFFWAPFILVGPPAGR